MTSTLCKSTPTFHLFGSPENHTRNAFPCYRIKIRKMEAISSSSSLQLPRKPANYDEISMNQSIIFSHSLKDLKNLRKQLYSAAEFFELSYNEDDQKQIVINTLKEYTIKALVNTVDHLGSVTCKVSDILDDQVHRVSNVGLRVSCVKQRIRTCKEYVYNEGLAEQSLAFHTPKYHKRYILPVGETIHGATRTKSKCQGRSLDDEDDWHEFRNAVRATLVETPAASTRKERSESRSPHPQRLPGTFSFTGHTTTEDENQISPNRFPLIRTRSFSSRSRTPNSRQTSPNTSRTITPNARRRYSSEQHRSVSMRFQEASKDGEQIPSKSKRLLKALLSRRTSKKDENLLTYLDEY